MEENKMKEIKVSKVTVNARSATEPNEVEKAVNLLKKLTGEKPIKTRAKVKQPAWNVRPGIPLGAKVTLRKEKATKFLERILKNTEVLKKRNFDAEGNLSFGIPQYINIPGIKYDSEIGMRGFEINVSIERKGYRIKRRKEKKTKIGRKHRVNSNEAIEFIKKKFGVSVV